LTLNGLWVQYKVGPAAFAGILLKKDPATTKWIPVATYSRTWDSGKLLISKFELEMRALQETLSKLRHITDYASKLEVQASEELQYLARMAPKLHPQL
jgi:hypothetical protein